MSPDPSADTRLAKKVRREPNVTSLPEKPVERDRAEPASGHGGMTVSRGHLEAWQDHSRGVSGKAGRRGRGSVGF